MLRHPSDVARTRTVQRSDVTVEELHENIIVGGKLVYDWPDLHDIRARRRDDVARLDTGVRRLIHPHIYHVSLSERLWNLKYKLIAKARRHGSENV